MRILHLTDLHLDCLEQEEVDGLYKTITENDPELILVGGDTKNGDPRNYLYRLSEKNWQDIYYVFGNHDFYGESIERLRQHAAETDRLKYLPKHGVVHLNDNTSLIGHDGWGDSRNGFRDSAFLDYRDPRSCILSDFHRIKDLRLLYNIWNRNLFFEKLEKLGDEAAKHLETHLQNTHENVIVLTHIPPFTEACFYRDENDVRLPQTESWSPFFTCKAMGDVLMRHANMNLNKRIMVLAGHMHEPADVQITENLRVIVGAGSYEKPQHALYDTDEIFSSWRM